MMSKETIANNAAFRLFLVVAFAIVIMLLLSMNWNRGASSTVVTPNQNEVVKVPAGSVRP
jgi:hypothetical protein